MRESCRPPVVIFAGGHPRDAARLDAELAATAAAAAAAGDSAAVGSLAAVDVDGGGESGDGVDGIRTWMDGWMDGSIFTFAFFFCLSVCLSFFLSFFAAQELATPAPFAFPIQIMSAVPIGSFVLRFTSADPGSPLSVLHPLPLFPGSGRPGEAASERASERER